MLNFVEQWQMKLGAVWLSVLRIFFLNPYNTRSVIYSKKFDAKCGMFFSQYNFLATHFFSQVPRKKPQNSKIMSMETVEADQPIRMIINSYKYRNGVLPEENV